MKYSRTVQFDSFWLRRHHNSLGNPKSTVEGGVSRLVRIYYRGAIVSEQIIIVSEKDWLLVMPKTFTPQTD